MFNNEQLALLSTTACKQTMDNRSEIVLTHYSHNPIKDGCLNKAASTIETLEQSDIFSNSADSTTDNSAGLNSNNFVNVPIVSLSKAKICWLNRIKANNTSKLILTI